MLRSGLGCFKVRVVLWGAVLGQEGFRVFLGLGCCWGMLEPLLGMLGSFRV